jgi:hypothetical protein
MRSSAAAIVLISASLAARAADLPPAPSPGACHDVPVAPLVYNWGDVYVGINSGWGFGTAKRPSDNSGFPSDSRASSTTTAASLAGRPERLIYNLEVHLRSTLRWIEPNQTRYQHRDIEYTHKLF